MLDSLAPRLIQYRWLLLCLSLLLAVVSGYGSKHFQFDGSPRVFFADDYPYFTKFEAIEAKYGKDLRTFIMFSPEDGQVFSRESLDILEKVTELSWQLPFVTRVDSLVSHQHTQSIDDDLYVAPLVEQALDYSDADLARIKDIAINDEGVVRRLVSDDGKYAAIALTLNYTEEDRQAKEKKASEAIYSLIADFEAKYPGQKFYITGNIISNYNNTMIAMRDIGVMVPSMFALMFVMLGLLLRTISGVLVAFIIAILATASGVGLGSWLGITFSMMSMNVVIISITVALAHCIHILSHFFHSYRSMDKKAAITESIRINFVPVSITSGTTALGFITLNFGDLPPAADLGNVASLAVLYAWLFSLTVLPALVILLPFKKRQGESSWLENKMVAFSGFIIARQKLVLAASVLFCLFMAGLAAQNVINDRFSEMIRKPHQFRVHNEKIDQHFGGLYTMSFDFVSMSEKGIADPEYLAQIEKFALWLRSQDDIQSVYSFTDVIKRLNQNMHGDDPSYYKIPASSALTAQYLLLYEMSVPYGLDLNNQISLDKQAMKVTVTYASKDTWEVFDLQERIRAWQAENWPQELADDGGSLAIMWSHLSLDSIISGIKGSFIALVIISIVMMLVLGSVRYGVVSLIPNILPAVVGFGFWAIYRGELSMGLTSVVIITLGIVVDDTVHFLSKYQHVRKHNNASSEQAIQYAFKHVGTALWITTLVLVSGFALLMLSKLAPNADLGALTALILVSALVLDFFMLPTLLLLLDRNRKEGQQAEVEDEQVIAA